MRSHVHRRYGKHLGEKLFFTIGVAYCGAPRLGFLRSFTKLSINMKYGISETISNTLSTVGRTTSEFGNGASATLLYCLIGGFLDLVFEEEIKVF